MNIKNWLKCAGIRAVKTMAQTFIATVGTTNVVLSEVNWLLVASSTLLSGIFSLVTSLGGLPELKEGEDNSEDE